MKFLDGFETPTPIERGVFDVDDATYRADPALNFHRLADFHRDPKAFRDGFFESKEESDAMRFGTACHLRVLQGEEAFAERVAVFKPPINEKTGEPFGPTTKAFQEARAAFEKDAAGKTMISQTDAETIDKIADELNFHPIAPTILAGDWEFSEVAIRGELATARGNLVEVKGKLDRFCSNGLIDLKTTASFDDASGRDRFRFALYDYKYLLQLGFYHLLLTEICGAPFVPAYLIAAEKNAPNRVAVYAATRAVVESARDVCRAWLDDWADARTTDYYPSRFDGLQIVEQYNPQRDI